MDRLRQRRDGGHLRYVLLRGVIGWGMPTALLHSFLMSLWAKVPFLDSLPAALVGFGVGGIAFGEFMWRIDRRKPGGPWGARPRSVGVRESDPPA